MYASEADLDAAWGSALIDLLTLDDTTLLRDAAKIASALEGAQALANSYVARRYPMPLTPTADGAILMRKTCSDLAVYQLATTADRMTDIIQKRYEAAIAFLKDVAAAKADVAAALTDGGGDPITPGEAVLESNPRVFSRDSLRGM